MNSFLHFTWDGIAQGVYGYMQARVFVESREIGSKVQGILVAIANIKSVEGRVVTHIFNETVFG